MARLGVMALQGGFRAHLLALRELAVEVREVRRTRELAGLDGLVIPGGESTTLLNLMRDEPWFDALGDFHRAGGALLGTCAGAILLAREVIDPAQPALGLLDATIRRNGFGRQVDSFEADLRPEGEAGTVRAVFIRAPRFTRLGPQVEVLARLDGEAVLVRQERVLAATFHPELTADRWLHRRFVDTAADRAVRPAPQPPVIAAGQRRITC